MKLDRYFWIAMSRIVGFVFVAVIFLIGLNAVIGALFTKQQILYGVLAIGIGGIIIAFFMVASLMFEIASEMAATLREKATHAGEYSEDFYG